MLISSSVAVCYVDVLCDYFYVFFFFFKQKTAYELRISDWSSDVCSSDLQAPVPPDDVCKVIQHTVPARQRPQLGTCPTHICDPRRVAAIDDLVHHSACAKAHGPASFSS